MKTEELLSLDYATGLDSLYIKFKQCSEWFEEHKVMNECDSADFDEISNMMLDCVIILKGLSHVRYLLNELD